jgi:surface protein
MNWLSPLGENSFTDSWVKERVPVGGSGGGTSNPDFVATWSVASDGDSITLPLLSGGTYSGTINWGDGSSDTLSYANRTHTFASAGTKTITLSGTIDGFKFDNGGDKTKFLDVSNWGNLKITTNRAFFGCTNFTISATDAPLVTAGNGDYWFYNCHALGTPDLSSWDVSSVTNWQNAFRANNLNPIITGWIHGNVTKVRQMFLNNTSWNRSLDGQDFSGVTDAYEFMRGCTGFNSSVANLSFGTNANLYGMLQSCTAFTGTGLDSWNTSNVDSFNRTFSSCSNMNGDISAFDTSNVTNMTYMLNQCDAFRGAMDGWDINQVTNLASFMNGATGTTTVNYDALLIAWDAQGAMSFSGTANFGGSKYTSGGAAETARTSLISKWGGIVDGGAV